MGSPHDVQAEYVKRLERAKERQFHIRKGAEQALKAVAAEEADAGEGQQEEQVGLRLGPDAGKYGGGGDGDAAT